MLAHQETKFVRDLAEKVGERPVGRFDRDDVSLLMTTLRCGTDLDVLLATAPKVNAARLLAAWRALEEKRKASADAWARIVANPSERSVLANADAARVLLPVPMGRIMYRLGQRVHDDLINAVADTAAEVHKMHVLASSLEGELAECAPDDERGVALGVRLYNPHHPGVYASPFYCPTRVSAITPLRLRDLLNERTETA